MMLFMKYGSMIGTLTLAIVSLAFTTPADAQISASPSPNTAGVAGLSLVLSPSYAGLGIEPSNLFAFTGTNTPNAMTIQLLNNLANYTGAPPHIRVGGNTADTALYNSSYNGYYFLPNPDTTGPTDVSYYGPNFFKVINYLPKNTPITYGLPLAYQGTTDRTNMSVAIAQGVVDAFTSVKLYSLEVGNEPDLYVQNQYRASGWGAAQFGAEWITDVQAVYNQVLKPKGITETFFEAACTATTAANRGFRIEDLVKTGVATDNGVYLGGWNQHDYYYYVNVSNYQLTLNGLMDLSSTSGQFTEWASQSDQANVTGKPYYLREMGSVGPEGIDGISNVFGNTLWTFNFFLYAATVGVQSVQLHALQYSYGSPWQPIPDQSGNGPYVRSSYCAWAAIAQTIGAKCQTQVAPIMMSNLPSGYGNRFNAYAIYNAGSLQSIAVINTKLAYQSSGSGISSQQVTFSLPSLAGQTFYISQLTAAGADAYSGTTWNGISYEQTTNGAPKKVDNTVRQVQVGSDGSLTFSVRDSQAVVANLGSVLGTQNNVVDTKACNALTQVNQPSGGSGFKATSGFASHLPLSLGAIIGIAAGGGVALLALLTLCIWCCVRRKRRSRAMAMRKNMRDDKANLLPPSYTSSQASNIGKRGAHNMPYRNVPMNDMADSSDDIFMMPVRGKGAHDSNSTFRGHKHTDSYGSNTPSMSNSPLMPSSPSFASRPRLDSGASHDGGMQPPSAGYGSQIHNGSPKPTSRLRGGTAAAAAAGAAVGLSNLNPKSAGNGGRRDGAANAQHQPSSRQQQQWQNGQAARQQQASQFGQADPWQQVAQQQRQYMQQQGYNMQPSPNNADAQRRSYDERRAREWNDARARHGSTPTKDSRQAAAVAAATGALSGHGASSPTRERRSSLPSQRPGAPAQRAAATKQSGAASSQGHGYNGRVSQDYASRPPVPPLPPSVRQSQNEWGGEGYDSNQAAISAAMAAAASSRRGGGGMDNEAAQQNSLRPPPRSVHRDQADARASTVNAPAFMNALGRQRSSYHTPPAGANAPSDGFYPEQEQRRSNDGHNAFSQSISSYATPGGSIDSTNRATSALPSSQSFGQNGGGAMRGPRPLPSRSSRDQPRPHSYHSHQSHSGDEYLPYRQ